MAAPDSETERFLVTVNLLEAVAHGRTRMAPLVYASSIVTYRASK